MLALQAEYGDKIAFIIADTDTRDGYELARQYGVNGIPAFFCLDGTGRTTDELYGFRGEEPLRAAVEKLLP
ncbi:MAG: thioredoxin family protein [bacterium]